MVYKGFGKRVMVYKGFGKRVMVYKGKGCVVCEGLSLKGGVVFEGLS